MEHSMTVQCVYDECEELFKTEQGMKTHHKRIHGESIAGVSVECDSCGTTIVRKQFQVDKKNNLFCDHDCYAEFISEERNGEDAFNWQGGINTVETKCGWCGEKIAVPRQSYENSENNFCGQDCSGQYKSEYYSGENSWTWEGGWDGYRGESWKKIRREILERDDYECQNCGIDNHICHEKQYSGLHVHHIEKFMEFDDPEEANKGSNLISLCPECHHEVENE